MDVKTSKKLNGNGFWESSRMMLPEHKAALIEMRKEERKRTKPNVDFEAVEEISKAIADSYTQKTEITIEIFNPYGEHIETGVVEAVSQLIGEIKISGIWVKFSDIIGIK